MTETSSYDCASTSNPNAEEVFLAELKSQFEKEIDLRKNLDNKANAMITITSGISSLIIAIGTFLITRIVEKNLIYGLSILILSTGVVLAVIAIWFLIRSYSLRNYTYPMGHEFFFDNDQYQKEKVESVRNLKKEDFNSRMYKGYLESIKTSSVSNENKARGIMQGQKILTATLATVSGLVAFILISLGLGLITLM